MVIKKGSLVVGDCDRYNGRITMRCETIIKRGMGKVNETYRAR